MGNEILRYAQDDTGEPIRLYTPNELIEQYGGNKGAMIGKMVASC